jgi:hypothetical protein
MSDSFLSLGISLFACGVGLVYFFSHLRDDTVTEAQAREEQAEARARAQRQERARALAAAEAEAERARPRAAAEAEREEALSLLRAQAQARERERREEERKTAQSRAAALAIVVAAAGVANVVADRRAQAREAAFRARIEEARRAAITYFRTAHLRLPLSPYEGLAGAWLLRRDYLELKGERKSFGYYRCDCRKTWGSAHAFPTTRQACKECDEWSYPLLMWFNTEEKQARHIPDGDDRPHDRERCERCCKGLPCVDG